MTTSVSGTFNTTSEPSPQFLGFPFIGGIEPIFKSPESVVKSFMTIITPKLDTATNAANPNNTSTTSSSNPLENPLGIFEVFAKTLIPTSSNANNSEMLISPAKVLDKLVTNSASQLVKAGQSAGELANKVSSQSTRVRPETEEYLYEYDSNEEPYMYRRPKYFSRDCQFRVACEVGKLLKPVGHPLGEQVKTNKLVQDLQNRYTRAISYGMLVGDCERYYCLVVQIFGGPKAFASGVAELFNRFANPEMYE